MKCYYDVLEIEKSVSQDSIKKAYYKLSLRWHPDKNPDNIAEATEIFQEIQRAYKVLSNPQERTWYDKNRERFLFMNFNSEDELYALINNIVFTGFGDDENGFYSVHEHIFSVLISRENEACRIRGETIESIPAFGNSTNSYKEVVGPFYSFWESFSTKMSFHWKNKHEINLSYSREIRRVMEKENTDERNFARKEYNKTIRNLIVTLKVRDPRIKLWKDQLLNKAKDNEKKAVQMAQKAWERSQQKLNMSSAVPIYGDISVDELEDRLNRLEVDHGKMPVDKDSEGEDLYCVACNKYFKSLPSFNNHGKSKNHKKNLDDLRKQMLKEHNELFSDFVDKVNILEVKEDNLLTETTEKPVESMPISCENLETDELNVLDLLDEINVEVVSEKLLEKKRRRKPKAEKTEQYNQTSQVSVESSELLCQQCGTEFVSRNKLFQHVKNTNHASIKTTGTTSKSNKKDRNKKFV